MATWIKVDDHQWNLDTAVRVRVGDQDVSVLFAAGGEVPFAGEASDAVREKLDLPPRKKHQAHPLEGVDPKHFDNLG